MLPLIPLMLLTASGGATTGASLTGGIAAIVGTIGAIYCVDGFAPRSEKKSLQYRASLRRQAALLAQRQEEAEAIAEDIRERAMASVDEVRTLQAQEMDAASLLVNASREVAHTATILDATRIAQETIQSGIEAHIDRQEAMTLSVKAVPDQLAVLSREIEEKRLQIAALQSQIATYQVTRESDLQLVTHVKKLTSLTQEQADTIRALQEQQSQLVQTISAMAEEMQGLPQSEMDKENMAARTTQFFR